ncbi:SDR family oxidoreductase [bacterium]|nr:SDR family oxidoreductase [bacterium]
MTRSILIFGATSRIAECVARKYAEQKASIILVGRNQEKLGAISQDLLMRGANDVQYYQLDLAAIGDIQEFFTQNSKLSSVVDTVLVAHGVLPNQQDIQNSWTLIRQSYEVNLMSAMCIATEVTQWFEEQGRGTLAVITSVAGDRARKSNYIYGAAKGGLSLFLQGLRNRFGSTPIRIIDIRPGFVDTPMTAHLPKGPLFAEPERVAEGIVKAIDRGADIVYLPWFWRWILLCIRLIPEVIFKKLSL